MAYKIKGRKWDISLLYFFYASKGIFLRCFKEKKSEKNFDAFEIHYSDPKGFFRMRPSRKKEKKTKVLYPFYLRMNLFLLFLSLRRYTGLISMIRMKNEKNSRKSFFSPFFFINLRLISHPLFEFGE